MLRSAATAPTNPRWMTDTAVPFTAGLTHTDRQRAGRETKMDEDTARALIKEHFDWASKDEGRASKIYSDDAVIEFPQSGERLRGKSNIIGFRTAYPANV